MTLHDRCQKMLYDLCGKLPVGQSVDDLVAFVVSEIGRAAHETFEDSVPLCLYFSTEDDRREFIDAVELAKPGWIKRTWPA